MKHLSGRQCGRMALVVGVGLMGAAMAAMIVRACHVEPIVTDLGAKAPSAPALAAPPPAPAASSTQLPPRVPTVVPVGPQLVVHNPCSQALLLAVNVGNASGHRVTAGFFEVQAGARMTLATASGAIVVGDPTLYYYTETEQTEPVETGNRQQAVGDRMVGMKRIRLEVSERHAIDLECPGATSGRP